MMQNNRWRLVWRGVLLSAVLGLVAVLVWGSLKKLNRQKADQEHAKAKEVAVQRQADRWQ